MKAAVLAALLVIGSGTASGAQTASPAANAPATPATKTWFVRLIPPRATFAQDMTDAEKKVMDDHYTYWKARFEEGVCLFGGPVLDPKGVYGVLAIRAATQEQAQAIASADPSVKSGLNHIEVSEMVVAFLGASHPQN